MIEFLDIAKGLAILERQYQNENFMVAAARAEGLRKLFEDAHTGWLELEHKQEGK